jgi:hypothetical protein
MSSASTSRRGGGHARRAGAATGAGPAAGTPPATVVELLYAVVSSTGNTVRAGAFVLVTAVALTVGVTASTGHLAGGLLAGVAGGGAGVLVAVRRPATRKRRR